MKGRGERARAGRGSEDLAGWAFRSQSLSEKSLKVRSKVCEAPFIFEDRRKGGVSPPSPLLA